LVAATGPRVAENGALVAAGLARVDALPVAVVHCCRAQKWGPAPYEVPRYVWDGRGVPRRARDEWGGEGDV